MDDLDAWLGEVEGQLMSEDYGKDLVSVQNLQKKHDMVETDVNSHQVGRVTLLGYSNCNM